MRAAKRIGVLGGSFDPPHAGHLMIAREARARVGLDAVLFIPAGEQWLKEGQAVAAATHRLAMTHLAVQRQEACAVLDVEVTRPGPSYTVDTLTHLAERADAPTEWFFILGADALDDLPRWSRPQELARLCSLIVMPRAASGPSDVSAVSAAVPGLRERVIILEDAPRVDISSSSVRRMMADGAPMRGIVPDAVARYIAAHRLYP